ncbi:MAG: glycosyl transferase [Ignavibacteria bacterium]|nr:MAG: glycosyl transferase [Ignavibacteria bacterium]KAF0161854.1 MAG: glycosyl transferase [Ignavibacteria bacterium]
MQVYKSFRPVVSVILPTFNREKLLQRAVDSVINQTFFGWELIIIDDGSKDKTFELVNSYFNNFENIRYIKHTNRRPPLSQNVGLLASAGEFVSFLGSDDQYKPTYLEERVNFLRENPEIDLIHGGVEIIGHPFVKDKNDLSKEIHLSDCVIGGTFLGKRNIFLDLNGFTDLKYSDDSDFFERAVNKYKIVKVDFPTYIYYRDTPDSICSTIKE